MRHRYILAQHYLFVNTKIDFSSYSPTPSGVKRRAFLWTVQHPAKEALIRRRLEWKKALLNRVKLFEWKAAITYPPNG